MAWLTADGCALRLARDQPRVPLPLLDPILAEFASYADQFTFSAPQRILIDNLTGTTLGRSTKLDGEYWRRHARRPVQFAKSVRTLSDLGVKVLLEIGPSRC